MGKGCKYTGTRKAGGQLMDRCLHSSHHANMCVHYPISIADLYFMTVQIFWFTSINVMGIHPLHYLVSSNLSN